MRLLRELTVSSVGDRIHYAHADRIEKQTTYFYSNEFPGLKLDGFAWKAH